MSLLFMWVKPRLNFYIFLKEMIFSDFGRFVCEFPTILTYFFAIRIRIIDTVPEPRGQNYTDHWVHDMHDSFIKQYCTAISSDTAAGLIKTQSCVNGQSIF